MLCAWFNKLCYSFRGGNFSIRNSFCFSHLFILFMLLFFFLFDCCYCSVRLSKSSDKISELLPMNIWAGHGFFFWIEWQRTTRVVFVCLFEDWRYNSIRSIYCVSSWLSFTFTITVLFLTLIHSFIHSPTHSIAVLFLLNACA